MNWFQGFVSEHPSLSKLSTILFQNFEKKFILQAEHKIACFLHPPYRRLKMFDSDEQADILRLTRRMLPTTVPDVPAPTVTVPGKRKSAAMDLSKYEDGEDFGPSGDEVSRYHELVCQSKVDDAAAFWKANEKAFSGLSRLAQQFLSPPAGSTPSERLFSKASFLIDDERSNLKSDKADDILFLYSNRDKF